MKIAVFHNYLDNIGGAEIVSLVLARELGADVYTTNVDPEKIKTMGFEDVLPRIYSIGKIPINAPLKQQMALWKFREFDSKNKYDFYIISGDWAVSGAVNNHPNLWYVHSPIREIWDLKDYTRKNIVPYYARWIFDLWAAYNQNLNKKYASNADKIVCNSENTKNRLKKYLNKEADVINPPIKISGFHHNQHKDYWLSVNRLIGTKRIDIQMKAFAKLEREKLIIVGSYEKSKHFLKYANWCKKVKPDNVEIKSWVSNNELVELYANCKGVIATANDEDFGMSVVEAMAAGKPVIAPNEGGSKETIINDKTGILIDDINEDKLIEAIKMIDKKMQLNPIIFKTACQEQAAKFDSQIFIEKIRQQISGLL